MTKKNLLILSIAAAVSAGACSDSGKTVTTPQPAVQQTKSQVTGTSAPSKVDEAGAPVYSYNPAGRRDPFMPIIIKEEKKGVLGKAPLEKYAISEFKLSGIVWGGLGYRAMLEGPDGKGYFIKEGTVIGPNRGVVKKITDKSMIIEEKYKDPSGEAVKKEIVIELRKKQEGTP